ncbi:MAG: Nin-like protein [Alphaproteobacteria bacterium]|nr:Nin-like protein [Alphaproteobacteria bacterium]MAS46453.1 Nin-like protein [Alphaproteobacteria bacterium]MAX94548.1 Nin-like protein [Alphaproteobacteria bacterium]MBN54500.1 Nin-like protein [Alphaproteobacteria bacterium]OUT41951.1 MAG: hypothetical protein CBB62_06490 [Micavibrio sp. TMED2]|tara:strand:- start:135 stop:965 length:831 start_codon:yes stop_codon:yes gene_type:complete
MTDLSPYILPEGNVHIAFSGGRTSAYMLHQIMAANGGLPDRAKVIFTNTGRELEPTLEFVREVERQWGVPIVWLEYRYDNGPRAQQVFFETAHRRKDPKPFNDLLRRKKRLPNQQERFCTEELKVRTARRWLVMQGWKKWTKAVGIRDDEPDRHNPAAQPREAIWHPMVAAGVSRYDVAAFWQASPFDLGLPIVNGKTIGGNCLKCFQKSEKQIASFIRDIPDDTWPDDMEAEYAGTFSARYSHRELRRYIEKQGDWIFDDDVDVLCQADGGECSG